MRGEGSESLGVGRNCGERFSDSNVYSQAGWLETQISGLCEVCFDALADLITKDEDDDEPCRE